MVAFGENKGDSHTQTPTENEVGRSSGTTSKNALLLSFLF